MQKANLENLEKRQKQIEQEINNNILELDRTKMKKEDIAKSFNEIENNRNKILKNIEEINSEKEKVNSKIKEYDLQIVNSTNEMRMEKVKI